MPVAGGWSLGQFLPQPRAAALAGVSVRASGSPSSRWALGPGREPAGLGMLWMLLTGPGALKTGFCADHGDDRSRVRERDPVEQLWLCGAVWGEAPGLGGSLVSAPVAGVRVENKAMPAFLEEAQERPQATSVVPDILLQNRIVPGFQNLPRMSLFENRR